MILAPSQETPMDRNRAVRRRTVRLDVARDFLIEAFAKQIA